jgi:hypothetical protein
MPLPLSFSMGFMALSFIAREDLSMETHYLPYSLSLQLIFYNPLNQALGQGHLSRPLPLTNTHDFPVIQYADDMLIIVPADEADKLF